MRRGTLFGALVGALVAATATPAAAQDTSPSWNCRASVLQLFGTAAEPRFEPLVANGDGSTGGPRAQCADDDAGLPVIDQDGLYLSAVAAATRLTPPTGASRDQAATAGATVADARFSTPGGELVITAKTIQAGAKASCANGAPVFEGGSTVVDLSVNGQKLPVDDTVLNEITQQVNGSPLGGLIKVILNDKVQTADGLTVQAVRIELFSAAGSPQGTVVLGEAKVSSQNAACAPAQPATPTTGTNGTNGTNGTPGTPGANGTNGTNGTSTTGSSGAGRPVNEVVINGSNGGCGRLKVWWEKVDLLHRLPGRPMKTTSRFGQRAMMRGQLVACRTGKPIVGAILDHYHHVGQGVGKLTKTGIKTRSAGKFTYIQPLNLTTRRIVLVYRGNLASNRPTTRKTLRLIVRGKKGQIIRGKPPRTLE